MTALALLFWIALGVALQLAIFLGISFWRHWRDYDALRRRVVDSGLPSAEPPREEPAEPSAAGWSGWRTFRVERKVVEDGAQSVCSFYLVPEDGQALPSFLPGQFLTFRFDIPTAAGSTEQVTRCYSLSDAPRADHYRISVKRVPAPAGQAVPAGRSSNHLHDHVDTGSLLQVRAPAGHFHIDQGTVPVVLIAGGIGITPLLSMVNWCLAEQPQREVWLFYGVRDGREQIMRAQLDALAAAHPNFHLHVCFSQPQDAELAGQHYQHRGRVDVALLRLQLPLQTHHFYVCGPTAMLQSLVPALQDWGVPDAHIHYEAFGPASIPRRTVAAASVSAPAVDASQAGIVVTFARSGQQLRWQPDAGSLLEFAEAHGIALSSGCRAGGCGTCQTTIVGGEVSYRQAPDYDPEPGTCLPCVCVPKTPVTLEA